jgi:hypothetical protein
LIENEQARCRAFGLTLRQNQAYPGKPRPEDMGSFGRYSQSGHPLAQNLELGFRQVIAKAIAALVHDQFGDVLRLCDGLAGIARGQFGKLERDRVRRLQSRGDGRRKVVHALVGGMNGAEQERRREALCLDPPQDPTRVRGRIGGGPDGRIALGVGKLHLCEKIAAFTGRRARLRLGKRRCQKQQQMKTRDDRGAGHGMEAPSVCRTLVSRTLMARSRRWRTVFF